MKYLKGMRVTDSKEWLDVALDSKKVNVRELKDLEDVLKEEFDKYDSIVINKDLKPADSHLVSHKKLLNSYYLEAPSKLNALLIERRTDHDLLDCPFCGSPEEPDTLDHFVPKDHWPEFSINPNNLVPQCRGCAPVKSNKYYDENYGSTFFLHPMYSSLLSKFKFRIVVEFRKEKSFIYFDLRLIKPHDLSDEDAKKVIHHFDKLNLKGRVDIYCRREIRKWKNILSSKGFDIEKALKLRLNERALSDQCRDWKTALYKGILDNEDCLQYLQSFAAGTSSSDSAIGGVEIAI